MTNLAELTEELRLVGGIPVQAVTETERFLNVLIYGDSGVGKTRLSGSAVEVADMAPMLIVDVEGGTFTLESCYPQAQVVRVKSWADMQAIYDDLYDGEQGRYKTVCIDSITELQKFSMTRIMHAVVAKDSTRDVEVPSQREWGKNSEQIRLTVRAFRDLPMHTIFTALSKEDRDARTGITRIKPALPGKLASEVAAYLDLVLYMYTKRVDEKVERLLLTTMTDKEIAKDRSNRLPPVIQNPTMSELIKTVRGQGDSDPNL